MPKVFIQIKDDDERELLHGLQFYTQYDLERMIECFNELMGCCDGAEFSGEQFVWLNKKKTRWTYHPFKKVSIVDDSLKPQAIRTVEYFTLVEGGDILAWMKVSGEYKSFKLLIDYNVGGFPAVKEFGNG